MERKSPRWLGLLLSKKFFEVCDEHRDLRKSETNVYCIHCDQCLCSHCLAAPPPEKHRHHKMIQIRRYIYQDVVQVQDLQKFVDCSKVQTYTTNGAKVVLLNTRKQSKPSKLSATAASCEICGRVISNPFRYCSIACKVSERAVDEPGSSGVDDTGPILSSSSDLEAGEDSSSCLASPQPSDSSDLIPRIKKSRRKGTPTRSPVH
ncbi:PLATZ transcription factor protein [Dioscorea alata]|uniref:PLATZ transcription factor protein n=1 Tax=Dioscorea alata TaxID=55571 RepID=A0ACB7U8H3_DIOAL|nr:PLATZ transcription factor protein [Dioscorea alata]